MGKGREGPDFPPRSCKGKAEFRAFRTGLSRPQTSEEEQRPPAGRAWETLQAANFASQAPALLPRSRQPGFGVESRAVGRAGTGERRPA